MSQDIKQVESQYIHGGYVYHDVESNFTLNLSGFSPLGSNIKNVVQSKYKYAVKEALSKIESIENGSVVNKTANVNESEDRAVDHYNLRLKEEKVEGKSLKHSIDYFQHIKSKIEPITNGSLKNEFGETYTDVIFNGIGGSFLGPLMLVIAMKGDSYNFNSGSNVRLYFVSNTDPDSFHNLTKKLDLKRTIMVNMSKSGGTAETKGNMDSFNELLKSQKIDQIGKHNIAITTKDSKFDVYAKENKFLDIFYMFNDTGGRTSVCSAIGMVPSAFAGLEFDEFLRGQSHMDELTRKEDAMSNPAMLIAVSIDVLTKKLGQKNMIVLGYSDFLKEFAHYLQQLYMESLGKEYDEFGIPRPEGQTVFGGVGTGEQHAFMQQVQKGIPDCFVRFVHFLKRNTDYTNSSAGSMGRQLLAFVKGTEDALLNNDKPFITSTFEQCNMFNLGMMVALEERIVTILAAFKGINAYDQPGVQDGKLSASSVNKYSIALEKAIADKAKAKWEWKGDAENAKSEFKVTEAPVYFVDAILSDIFANISIDNSYHLLKDKLEISREFQSTKFVYHFKSKL